MKKVSMIITILLITQFFLPILAAEPVLTAGQTQADKQPPQMIIDAGNYQKIQVKKPTPVPLTIKVIDAKGKPVFTTVEFFITKGDGKISSPIVETNSEGFAKTRFEAGLTPGDIVVSAKLSKFKHIPRQFYLTVTLDNPNEKPKNEPIKILGKTPDIKPEPAPSPSPVPVKTPEIISKPAVIIGFGGNNQKVAPGTEAKEKIQVQVLDSDGKSLPGITVKFSVIEGPGNLPKTDAITDNDGIAAISVIAGDSEGSITVKAEIAENKDLSTVLYLMSEKEKAPIITPSPTPEIKIEPSPAPSPEIKVEPSPVPSPEIKIEPSPSPSVTPEIPAPETTEQTPIKPETSPEISTPSTPVEAYTPEPTPQVETIQIPKNEPKPRGYMSTESANISVVGGNFQNAEPGMRLPQPIVVYVTDADNNPADANVQFTVLSGDAAVLTSQARTDERGLASTFVIVNSTAPIRIVAEIIEKPGLATIAYANSGQGEARRTVAKSKVKTNQPGYPAVISFYNVRSKNLENIEKTKIVPLEIGVTDFRNQPVSTAVRFNILKGNVNVLNPVVQTNADGRGVCYIDLGNSMGIFTIEAQSLDNPDLKALFKSGPQIYSGASEPDGSGQIRNDYKPIPIQNDDTNRSAKKRATASGKPALIAILKGGGQKGKIGSRLPVPIEVIVTDGYGKPSKDMQISFSIIEGKAKLEKTSVVTDENGKASTFITLGAKEGTVQISATVKADRKLRCTIQIKAVK